MVRPRAPVAVAVPVRVPGQPAQRDFFAQEASRTGVAAAVQEPSKTSSQSALSAGVPFELATEILELPQEAAIASTDAERPSNGWVSRRPD